MPAVGLGDNGDLYRDLDTGRDWEKVAGTWGLSFQATLPISKVTGRTYGTSFPASPADGDEHTLVDSTTTPTYQWRFRYNAGSSSSYKWESVGATSAFAKVQTQEQNSTVYPAYGNTATNCQITVPRAGDYEVRAESSGQNNTAGNFSLINIAKNGVAVSDDFLSYGTSTQVGAVIQLVSEGIVLGCAANDILKIMYAVNAGTGDFSRRRLFVKPVRCA